MSQIDWSLHLELLGFIGLLCIAFLWYFHPIEKDRLMYGNKPSILIVLMSVFVVCFVLTLCLIGEFFDSDKIVHWDTEGTVVVEHWWAIISQFADPGNLPSASGRGRVIAFVSAVSGVVCLSGLLVSSIVNYLSRRSMNWRQGLIHYNRSFNDYVVIIGCNEQTSNIIKLSLKRRDVKYVLLQTRQEVEKMRKRLDLALDRGEEKKLIYYYAERTSREDVELLHLEKAKEIYILGEDVTADNERDHDAFNIDCLENISAYMSKYRKKKFKEGHKKERRIRCHVNFEYQSTFTAFKATHIYRRLDKDIEFIPFNIHELWAKKVLVDNYAIYPAGEKGRVKVQRYLPIDGNDGINYDSEKTVNVVIVGMNQMGTAFGMQVALLAHYPNFQRDKKLKTTITFIDDHAKEEGDYLRGRFASLFDLCQYRDVVCKKDDLQHDGTAIKDVPFTDPMQMEGRYDHLGENFMDIQWEFIQGNIAEDKIKNYLLDMTNDPNKIVTIAICLNHPQQSIATALYLSGKIFRKAHQVLVYQPSSFDLINKVANGELEWKRYKNMYPFGMIEGSYFGKSFDNTMAKLEHFLYGFVASNERKNKKREEILDELKQETQGLKSKIDALWDELGIVQKYANIDLADSIPTKLRSLMGREYNGYPNSISKIINKDDRLLKRMAETEHNRWLTERLIMSYRPVDKQETNENGDKLKGWYYFNASLLDEKGRRREKRCLIEKNRAHLDICPYELLKVVDPYLLPNDENVIYYLPALLRHCERMNLESLLSGSENDDAMIGIFKTLRYVEKEKIHIQHSFWMGEAPITEKQWNAVMNMGEVHGKNQNSNLPVVNKSKDEIENFLIVLRMKAGLYFTLPSLNEWKYAAERSTKEYLPVINENDAETREKAWKKYLHFSDSKGRKPVKSFKNKQNNSLGLYDMLGNVWEWTRSSPKEQESCFYFCGGSWRFKSIECDLNKNYWSTFWNSKLKSNDLGFRVIWKYEDNIDVKQIGKNDANQSRERAEQYVKRWLECNMKHVDGGYFVMGTENSETREEFSQYPDSWIDSWAEAEETPHHFVKLDDFEISAIPVTQGLWNAVMDSNLKHNKSDHKGNCLPQTEVSWHEIVYKFLDKLNEISGKSFRLPTEAEWEYAAKGGKTNGLSDKLAFVFDNKDYYSSVEEMWNEAYRIMGQEDMRYTRFSGSDVADDVAWINDSTTQNVGQKKANGLGLFDMSGNVWEWCLDYYKNDFYKDCKEEMEYKTKGYIINPVCIDQSSSAHVFKGGSWLFSAKDCRNTCANYWIEDDEDNDLGFRIVVDNDKVEMKNFKKQ